MLPLFAGNDGFGICFAQEYSVVVDTKPEHRRAVVKYVIVGATCPDPRLNRSRAIALRQRNAIAGYILSAGKADSILQICPKDITRKLIFKFFSRQISCGIKKCHRLASGKLLHVISWPAVKFSTRYGVGDVNISKCEQRCSVSAESCV